MSNFRNLTNREIVTRALAGDNAVTTTGNMSTESYREGFTRYGAPYVGSLPHIWQRYLNNQFAQGKIAQVIYSYSTPIAWLDRDHGWIIPDVRYSITTSTKHQTHLYMLRGTHVYVPWDATIDDLIRAVDGRLVFVRDSQGRAIGTRPGPNYKAT